MPNFNKVVLMGNLCKDPEVRYTTAGAAVCNLRMAINRVYKSKTGEKTEETCFVTVVAWSKVAESAGEFLKKGDPILVDGRLQSSEWETEKKEKRTKLEVVAENIQFLMREGLKKEGVTEDAGKPNEPASEEDIPF